MLQLTESGTRWRFNSWPMTTWSSVSQRHYWARNSIFPRVHPPQTFEFVGICEKRAVKYDRSKVSKEAQEIASKGYIGNPPGEYKPNHEEGRSAEWVLANCGWSSRWEWRLSARGPRTGIHHLYIKWWEMGNAPPWTETSIDSNLSVEIELTSPICIQ